MFPLFRSFALICSCATLLISCAADRDLHRFATSERVAVPHFIELHDKQAISTVHFPRGTYRLEAEDNAGYYYRAPRHVVKHNFSGLEPYEGGIFLSRHSRSLRGYLVWAAGRTKIGDLSGARYTFRDTRG